MKITEFLKDHILYLDGGLGTLLQGMGLEPGELPERWSLSHREALTEIHESYFNAGSHVVSANTFGANSLKFSPKELEELIAAALENAKKARENSRREGEKWVALDVGPTGRMLAPYGDLPFEEAVDIFSHCVRLGEKHGADLIFIETMNDSLETKAAVLAAKENTSLPVFVSNAYNEDGKLMTGADPLSMVSLLEGLRVDAIGVNCSLGPKALFGVVREYLKYSSLPVLFKPNAGLPRVMDGRTEYDVLPEEFSEDVCALLKEGVRIAGGCCGTTPEYISALTAAARDIPASPVSRKTFSSVSSYTHAVLFGEKPVLIGERINPTGKKRFQQALREKEMDHILKEGIDQQEKGVHVLDVNVGLPEIDEVQMLRTVVCELQAVTDLPLQIDTADPKALEAALRCYNGKAMINSVNGKQESMDAVFPLAQKYGGLIVALTLDESGIPQKAEDRVRIAEKILAQGEKYGLEKKDFIFDPLTMAISAQQDAGRETLRAVRLIREKLSCLVSLGVSNVSFGLPGRDLVSSSFFTLALGEGLSAAIMNPYSLEMRKAYFAFLALAGEDENCGEYIKFAQELPAESVSAKKTGKASQAVEEGGSQLQRAIVKGLKEEASLLTAALLQKVPPMELIEKEVIPALDLVGEGFEKKTVYLPGLLMSAEAAKAAFEQVKLRMAGKKGAEKCAFVIAAVKGDIHDIGKNIVKLLLENYGFAVCDLGKDVPPELIVEQTVALHAPLVGLSALMTTTVPSMEETIRQLREKAPWCKVVVGGAVLTQAYADQIGADYYAKDAMETVRYGEKIYKDLSKGGR